MLFQVGYQNFRIIYTLKEGTGEIKPRSGMRMQTIQLDRKIQALTGIQTLTSVIPLQCYSG